MLAFLRTAGPLLQALAATVLAILAFAGMSGAGFSVESSLVTALTIAGSLNIYALASLNGDLLAPTSAGAVGEM